MNYISEDVKLGKDVRLSKFINLYGCAIGQSLSNKSQMVYL